jgi:hypothetical protein
MIDQPIAVELRDATESSAVLSLAFDGDSALPLELDLNGPFCEYAKTLPSRAAPRMVKGESRIEFLITEPCYWTPQLPFLYDLRMQRQSDRGVDGEFSRSVGLRRLIAHGRDLRLNAERIVLRGFFGSDIQPQMLRQARSAETALIAQDPDADLLDAAGKTGVLLMAAVTTEAGDLLSALEDLSWRPAAALVLLDRTVLAEGTARAARRMNLLLAQRLRAADHPKPGDVETAADVVAIELTAEERPPSWIASLSKPVIAIRSGRAYADFYEARAACDRLQAELAPEFDLAGYFV